MKKVIVIGAGYSGLASAALLAKEGYSVTVIEKNASSGGRARVMKEKGFVFDMGPSWYLMPEVFERFFKEFDKEIKDVYTLKRLDPAYRLFFGKNDLIDVPMNLEEVYKLFDSLEQGGAEKLKRYLDQAKYQYDVSMKEFVYKDHKSIFSFFNKRMLMEGRKLRVFENLEDFTKLFFSNDKLRKVLLYTMVFLGGAPKNTPAIYSIMSHIDCNLGVWYPQGGIGKTVSAIEKLAKKYKVQFVYNSPVNSICVENGVVKGVICDNKQYDADIVIVNADYHHAEQVLLERKYRTYSSSYWERRTVAPSAFIIYLGLNKKIKKLTHHNLFLENDWVNHFNEIFDKPSWPDSPSYYISCPSKTDSSVAPKGCENLFVLVPVASGLQDTEEQRKLYADKILKHLSELLGEDITKSIVYKKIYSHKNFISDYNAYKGTALGLTHTLMQTGPFRPKHESKKVKDLYFTGQYTHPGIGLPMTLISAQLVRDSIIKKYGNN